MTDSLRQFVESVTGESHLRVEQDFGDGFVRLRTSEAERRQAAQDIRSSENIVLELMRNSRDAHASHIFVAMSKTGDMRTLTVVDDGEGIPAAMHGLVFEPRVTSKLDTSHMDAWGMHGRGMALYSIAVNASTAFVADSAPGNGCSIHVETDTTKLPEKADQSSFPTFEMTDSATVNVRGPKNILRTVCEFAIEARSSCRVHIGSPAEIVSALYAYGTSSLSTVERLFSPNPEQVPIAKRLALAEDPQQLAELAAHIGLDISERTARRVLDGEIPDTPPILDNVRIITTGKSDGTRNSPKTRSGCTRNLKLDASDSERLADAASRAFTEIAPRYYLDPSVQPTVRTFKDRITISLPAIEK